MNVGVDIIYKSITMKMNIQLLFLSSTFLNFRSTLTFNAFIFKIFISVNVDYTAFQFIFG